jgi:hypothetical protein
MHVNMLMVSRPFQRAFRCRSAAALAAVTTLLILGVAPAHALLTNEVLTQNCVGHLQITDGDTVRVSCDGELTLSGGQLTSDRPLIIEGATGLHLLDVHVTAPEITLRSSLAITLNEHVNLDAPRVSMTAQEGATNASLTVAPGALIANQASLMVRTLEPTEVVGVTLVGIDRAGGTISVQPGTSLVAQDPSAADGAASAVVAAASAPEATPAAVSAAPAAVTSTGHEGGGGAVDGLGLLALAALAGVALARVRRV